MTRIFAASALLPAGIAAEVRLTIEHSRVARIETGAVPEPGDVRVGMLIPGMTSLHSHAFQRGMAGLAEIRGPGQDTFWTWRETMYRFALAMTPDQFAAVAAFLYAEMLEAGFTRVGEFHYLHHAPDGRPYDDIAEMAGRICQAAHETGIGLTLLPSFYAHGGFGGAAALPGQRRFVCDLDGFARLLEASRAALARLEDADIGIAPHSLRAVTPEELAAIVTLADGAPIHIHAAEQVKEVDDCLAWSGQRPVAWLLDNAALDRRWCLIHATHMTADETTRLAASGATAGLCPMTEASLGDGTFNATQFTAAGGHFGIGTDSNILIGVTDELRQLEGSQRLRDRVRNALSAGGGSTGEFLYARAAAGGAKALATGAGAIEVGRPADLVAINTTQPAFAAARPSQLLDVWIFASKGAVDRVWVGGREVVSGGRHRSRETLATRFGDALRALGAA